MDEELEFEEGQQLPDSPFHVEIDLYETGDHSRVLVVPCNETYVVVHNDEHLCTLEQTCKEPECWVQTDGTLDDELVEKLGRVIMGYLAE